MIKIIHKAPNFKEYIKLRISSTMGAKKEENAKVALKNSLLVVSIYDEEKLIGLGRIVGDGAISYVVTDIMVDLEYQGQGIGKLIMKEIDEYLEKNTDEDAYIILLANKPADKLYSKFNFEYSEPKSLGMRRIQK